MRRKNLDLLIAVVTAGASVAVILRVPSVPLRTAFALPLLFVLPGLVWTAALFPRGNLDLARRLVLQIGLSLSVGVLAALVLDVTFGLTRSSWTLLLASVTCVGAAVAAGRRIGLASPGRRLRRPRPLDAVLVGIALTVVAGSVAFARTPLAAKNVQGYTALSILPIHQQGDSGAVRIGVSSGELRPVTYRLALYVGPRLIQSHGVTLTPGSEWHETVQLASRQLSGHRWIRARLYRLGHPIGAYRSVRIRT